MTDYSNERFDRSETIEEERVELAQAADVTEAPRPPAPPAGKPKARRTGFILLGAAVALAALVYGGMQYFAPPSEETDDAYVSGNIVAITARQSGTVLALNADNTQAVQRGQSLIELDPAQQDVALAAAEARLGEAVRSVRSGQSAVAEGSAEIEKARTDLATAQADYARRKSAAAAGAISGEELSHANDAIASARAALTLAQARRGQAASTVSGTSVAGNPQVLSAIAGLRQAAINRAYMTIKAPVAGVVAQRTVQLGQQVAAGQPLMAVIPLDSVWIDANFRETQLADLRVGQPVTIVADVYGSAVTFHGKVLGLGAGSGNAFSLLPPQNASGNWIKIVQRVPVRIALDPKELRAHPLRIGLSAKVNVDTSVRSGPLVAASTPPAGGTQQSLDGGPQVDATVQRIIAANLGGRVR
ncbi:HlyD family efflux transporter periplasmic adaptor subunit [Sphingobium nicotianae]|uniref:HlyD family efflux transporter periplasmic adaptor subunit n=1 Tax=Sphingobium nicotianae TaxID=2782607 RepID=A0A9X1DF94_9SPHN|nr:HlyD family efflux transporter periplasmic adaptor subunit [Sphingobium nicotianae]MBT2189130.1 HlyD family efflux transporter periplasmic adaptor subunit [Sphingobium nicotianae]